MEGHEQPYLRGGSHDVIRTGHTFSDEPGVYIEGKVSLVFATQSFTNGDSPSRLACGSKTVFISLRMGLGCILHRMWADRANHLGYPER